MVYFSYQSENLHFHHTLDPVPREEDFPMHAHRSCEIYVFLSGDGYYTVEGTDYPLVPGTVLLMREGEAHKLHIRPTAPYERIAIQFSSAMVKTAESAPLLDDLFFRRPLGQNNGYLPTGSTAAFLDGCFRRMAEDTILPRENHIQMYLLPVLAELHALANKTPLLPPSPLSGEISVEKRENRDLVSRMIAYINTHLTEITGLACLEQEFFFSRSHLNRAFRQSTGSSLWEYILLKRLLAARAMLRSGHPAAVAAAACGFRDYSSFYRQYHRRFGVSPLEDREIR